MCLFVKLPTPKISDKEIIAYKIVRKTQYGYCTPFRDCYINFDRTYHIPYDDTTIINDALFGGVFHLFTYYPEADNELKKIQSYGYKDYEIIRAIIPANTEYYEGVFYGFTEITKYHLYYGIGAKSVKYELFYNLNEN